MRLRPLFVPLLLALPLFVAYAPGRALAAWPAGSAPNVPVCTAPGYQEMPAPAPDSCGGIIVVWRDSRSVSGARAFAQRIDASGQARWTTDGLQLSTSTSSQNGPDVCPDGSGGAFFTWDEERTAAMGRDIYVQHVLPIGIVDPAWPTDGVLACALPYDQIAPRIVPDGAGGAIAVWIDMGDGNVDIGSNLGAQRVNASGARLWGPSGVALADGPGRQEGFDVAAHGLGGVVCAYEDTRSGNDDIVTQRLDGTGARVWGATGIVLCTVTQVLAGPQNRDLRLCHDGDRTFVSWENRSLPPAPSRNDVFAQAIGPTGTVLWTPNGVRLTPGSNVGATPRAVPDRLGGVIVAWDDASATTYTLVAQRLDALGAPRWAPDVPVRGGPGVQAGPHTIVSDARNGAILVWEDYRAGGPPNVDLYAQRVSDTGVPLWTINGVALATSAGNQSLLDFTPLRERVVPDGAGGAVAAWLDERNSQTTLRDIYAQQIGASGVPGVRAPSANCEPDICGHAYTDFGDAPENIPALPSGSPGHYPTCMAISSPGTQEVACGAALSTPPGPTGYVEHVAGTGDALYVSLGCASAPGFIAADSEIDGLVNLGSGPPPLMSTMSACNPAAGLHTFEDAFGGLWFGGDEKAGPPGAGLASNPVLVSCATASLNLRTSACGPGNTSAYLNVLADWNQDGDWNDVVACGAGAQVVCAPEWAVKNALVTVSPGCGSLDTPVFRIGPQIGGSWMRITLTLAPVSDDFPWAGSALERGNPPGVPSGAFAGGETEDYPISVITAVGVGGVPATGMLMLAPIVPNPTAGSAELRFVLPAAATAHLGVYDLAGRRVRELASGRIAAGGHVVRWDGRDAEGVMTGSGLYFVRLEVGGRLLTRTVVRVR